MLRKFLFFPLLIIVFCMPLGRTYGQPLDFSSFVESSERWRFQIVPEESSISFFAETNLASCSGIAPQVEGFMEGVPKRLGETASSNLIIKMTSIETPKPLLWTRPLKKSLEVEKYPEAYFSLGNVTVIGQDIKTALWTLRVDGTLELHGVKKQIDLIVEGRVASGKIILSGKTSILYPDYGIVPPSLLGLLTIKPTIDIRFHLTGRSVPLQ